jgi:puromycin-sensitive aminopeptidase
MGVINKSFMKGVFRAKDTKSNASETDIEAVQFVTNLAPNKARTLFPCVDQPDIKAIFNLSVLVACKSHIALSNTPVTNEPVRGEPNQWYCFVDTPLMSTYLMVCIIGDFDYCEYVAPKSKVVCRGYAPVTTAHKCEHYVKLAAEAVDFYVDYFGLPYPLPKLDLVATH